MFIYEILAVITETDKADICHLLTILAGQMRDKSREYILTSREYLERVIANAYVFVARDPQKPRSGGYQIVGMATLVPILKPSNPEGSVEDVVVHGVYQRRGIARELMVCIHNEARKLGLRRLILTSNPNREAAHLFYLGLGYQETITDNFFLDL